MFRSVSFYLCVFLGFSAVPLSLGWPITLDTEKDVFMSWKITGHYLYTDDGENLRNLLPTDFDFKVFRGTLGLWAIAPDQDNVVDNTVLSYKDASASFACAASAQLFATVKIKYVSKGNATLYLLTPSHKGPTYALAASTTPGYEMIETEISMDPTSRFTIQANATGPPSENFIIIDRIVAQVAETSPRTTRSTTTTTTTPKPTPSPVVSPASVVRQLPFWHLLVIVAFLAGLRKTIF